MMGMKAEGDVKEATRTWPYQQKTRTNSNGSLFHRYSACLKWKRRDARSEGGNGGPAVDASDRRQEPSFLAWQQATIRGAVREIA